MTSVALIGASGNVGSRILRELSDRSHRITAIVRRPEAVRQGPNITAVAGDANDRRGLAGLLRGHEIVISAVHFVDTDPAVLIDAVKEAGPARYIVVGGAGSLELAPGIRLVDASDFPPAFLQEAQGGCAFLDLLKREDALDWTFISPPIRLLPGRRTGRYRIGGDRLLRAGKGDDRSFAANVEASGISIEDYAVAVADEMERPAHRRRRFTVAY